MMKVIGLMEPTSESSVRFISLFGGPSPGLGVGARAFHRRLAARIGKPKPVTATARKLAILVYRTLKGEITYADPSAAAYDRHRRQAALRNLRKRAQFPGFALVSQTTGEILQEGVS